MQTRKVHPLAPLGLALALVIGAVAVPPAWAQPIVEPVPDILGQGTTPGTWAPYRRLAHRGQDIVVESRDRYNGAVDMDGDLIPAARDFRARSANGRRVCMASRFVDVQAGGTYLQGGNPQAGWVNLRGDGAWHYVGGLWRGAPYRRSDGATVYPGIDADLDMQFRNC